MLVKMLISGFLFFLIIPASQAEYTEADLKSLFTTKQQRKNIDDIRYGKNVKAPVVAKKKHKLKKVKVSGYVTRSNGKSVVWVNGKSTLKNSRVGSVKVHKTKITNNKVTVNVDGKTVRIKPGETWTETKGVSDPVK